MDWTNSHEDLSVQHPRNRLIQVQRFLYPKEWHGERTQLGQQLHMLNGIHLQAELQTIVYREHSAR